MDCIECGGEVTIEKVPYSYKSHYFGTFKAEVCKGCGSIYFFEEATLEIERIAKEKGLWGKDLV